jgi:5-methylcytosine-specific restriction endonuclease McrA
LTPVQDFPICEFCHFRRAVCQHHLLPKSQGRVSDETNLVWLCHRCHVLAHEKGTEAFRECLVKERLSLLDP